MSDASLNTIRPFGRTWTIEELIRICFAVFVFSGAIAFIEPSPYDFASIVCIPLWFLAGFRIHWSFIPFAAMMTIYTLAGYLSLQPYWNEPLPRMFMFQSTYLLVTGFFFALFLAEKTIERAELCLKAYTASSMFASLAALLGYLGIFGAGVFMAEERAQGTFKDPNVLGSYVIPGALYCIHLLITGRTKHKLFTAGSLLLILSAIFLSFSRGSWLAFILSSGVMMGMTYAATPDARLRRKMLSGVALTVVCAGLLIGLLLSIPSLRDFFFQRAQGVGEEYADPRFLNQARSIPMLLERPLGFGPLRFRNWFDLEPHSSYVNGFASYGWLGGLSFILIVATTTWVGFRLCFANSPYRGFAQVFWPALMGFFLQGFQIDIDHWRHVYLLIGAVWALETARRRWLEREQRLADAALSPHPATSRQRSAA